METYDSIARIYEENKKYSVISVTILQSMDARRLNVKRFLLKNI
jgi:hypothetical protein